MTRNYPKRPRGPAQPLIRRPEDVVTVRPVLWRVHRTVGPHVLGWSQLRHWGPAPNMRFDPHSLPAGEHPDVGGTYTSLDLTTAVVEAFQDGRLIDTRTSRPRATSWLPSRPLQLLDLTDDWALRNGATHSLSSGPRASCRTWAHAIREAWPDLDGLWTQSTMTGRRNVTLWTPAEDAFPSHPDFSEALDAGPVWAVLEEVVARYPTYRLL